MKFLVIDDIPEERCLTIREMKKEFPTVEFVEVGQQEDFVQSLTKGDFDLVITDFKLGRIDGLTILRIIKERWPECPVVMFTKSGNEEIAVEALKVGLDEYVLKRNVGRLPIAVRLALKQAQFRKEMSQKEIALRKSEEKYRSLFDNANDAIYLIDPQTQNIFDCNKKASEMDGYSIDELKSMTVREPHSVEEWAILPEKLKDVLFKGAVSGISGLHHLRKDGRFVPAEVNATVIEIEGEKLNLSIVRDISERKQAEKNAACIRKKICKGISVQS